MIQWSFIILFGLAFGIGFESVRRKFSKIERDYVNGLFKIHEEWVTKTLKSHSEYIENVVLILKKDSGHV